MIRTRSRHKKGGSNAQIAVKREYVNSFIKRNSLPLIDGLHAKREFEFVLKKNKAENRILNDFTLLSCKLRLNLTFKSQFPYGEDNVFTFMLENNSAKRKAVSHRYNLLLFLLTCQLTS